MKKTGFAVVTVLLAAVLYYMTVGSSQLTEQMKQQVDSQLTILQQHGFAVNERDIKEKDEHFVISFDDTGKITDYLNKNAADVTPEEMAAMQGLKVGVDIVYLKDSYSAVSADIYPVALPKEVYTSTNPGDKAVIEHLKKMMKEKKLLVHFDFNKLLDNFKGYVKDINETFEDEVPVNIVMQGFTFKGETENEKLKSIHQSLKLLSLKADKTIYSVITDVTSSYLRSGDSPYETSSKYHIGTMEIQESSENFITLTSLDGALVNHVTDGLLKSEIHTKAESLKVKEEGEYYALHKVLFGFSIENLDLEALEKLQKANPQDEQTVEALSQKMISKGIILHIPEFSVQSVEKEKKTVDGFKFSSTLKIDKNYKIEQSKNNPLALLGALNGHSTLTVSGELFGMIAQDPRSMMLVMFFPPMEKEGNKFYDIKLRKGMLIVNGKKL